MAARTINNFAYMIVVAIIVTAAIVYFLWNKKHTDVVRTDGIEIAASVLYKSFTTDSAMATKNYVQHVLQVSGTASSITENQQSNTVILLKTSADGAYINCTMEEKKTGVKEGNKILIKGICNGLGQADADLGILGDVYLVRCYLVK